MHLHLEMRRHFPAEPRNPYRGIVMIDEVKTSSDRTPLLERRMGEYQAYVDRGGILTEEDMSRTALVEER